MHPWTLCWSSSNINSILGNTRQMFHQFLTHSSWYFLLTKCSRNNHADLLIHDAFQKSDAFVIIDKGFRVELIIFRELLLLSIRKNKIKSWISVERSFETNRYKKETIYVCYSVSTQACCFFDKFLLNVLLNDFWLIFIFCLFYFAHQLERHINHTS